MKGFSIDRVEGRVEERSAQREEAEAAATERQAFHDEVEDLLRDFPDIADEFRLFSSLASDLNWVDSAGVAEARDAVHSRLRSAAAAYFEICEQASQRASLSSLGTRVEAATRRFMYAASKPEPDFSSVDNARAYYRQVFAEKGFLDSPEQQDRFDEQWSYIIASRDFIEEASSELRRVRDSEGGSSGSYW